MGASVPGDVGFVKNDCGNAVFFFQMVAVLDSVLEEAQKPENEDIVRMEHILQAVRIFV